MDQPELRADPGRAHLPETGIPIRTSQGSVDLAHLDRESLLAWLRLREGTAERTVLMLLGHPTV